MGGIAIQRFMITVNDIRLFCRDTVEGQPTLLCLHGKWGRGETWTDLISRLGNRYRIIAPDQRGHGLSDAPVARYAPDDFAKDTHELIEQLTCGPVIAVGHSMGGRHAAYLAAHYPDDVRALVVLDQPARGPDRLSDIPPDLVIPVDNLTDDWPTPYPTYEHALQDLAARFPRPTNVRYFLESLTETEEGYDFLFSRYAMAAIEQYREPWFDLLPKIACPTLLVRASESWCLPKDEAETMRMHIPNCDYFEVSDSDHMVYADNPMEFYPRLEQFLSSL